MPVNESTKKRIIAAFGANVRRERVQKGLTQERLAELTGLYPRTIQKIEASEINILITTAARIQKAIGCSWESLFRGVNK